MRTAQPNMGWWEAWLNRMTLSQQLILVTSLALAVLITVATLYYVAAQEVNQRNRAVIHAQAVLTHIDALSSLRAEMEYQLRAYLLTGEDTFHDDMHVGLARFYDRQSQLGQLLRNEEEYTTYERLVSDVDTWRTQTVTDLIDQRAAGANMNIVLRSPLGTLTHTLDQQLQGLQQTEENILAGRQHTATVAQTRLTSFATLGAVLGSTLTLLLGAVAAHYIGSHVSRVATAAQRLAEGDLSQRVEAIEGRNEIAVLSRSFNQMADRIAETQETLIQLHLSLRDERDRLAAVLDTTDNGILMLDREGRLGVLNRRLKTLLGLPDEKEEYASIEEVMSFISGSLADPLLTYRLAEQVMQNPLGTIETDFELTAPVHRVLHLYLAPVHSRTGAYIGMIASVRDVTQEREADRMKNEFVSLVSHEFRTPLTAVRGFTELMLDGDVGEINPKQMEYLGILKTNVDRLVDLINDLLDIARIEAGRIRLKLKPLLLPEIVQEVVDSYSPMLAQKSQELTVEVPADIPPILADSDQLVRVLHNLVSNAHKYTPAGGAITLRAGPEDGMVRVSVTDTGIGIEPEHQAKLFTRFYRVDNGLARNAGGTGLGLYIVKSIIELQGGQVAVTSEVGHGSTFSITLPIAAERPPGWPETPPLHLPPPTPLLAADARLVSSTIPPANGPWILVIEDDPDVARLIQHYLEQAGHVVVVVASAEAALVLIEQHMPSLITLDVRLPGKSGYDLAAYLAASPTTRHFPVVVISIVHEEVPDLKQRHWRVLPKPVNREALVQSVEALLNAAAQPSILVVDDDEGITEVLSAWLTEERFTVLTAQTGERALELARWEQPKLILLDLIMPKMDGFTVLETLKRNPTTAPIPVIVMTGNANLKDFARPHALALGAAEVVAKPLEMDSLVDTLRELLDEGTHVSNSVSRG